MAQAEHIREEGARYNLGNMRSTLGNPVLALGVLQQSYQPRFQFLARQGGQELRPRRLGRRVQGSRRSPAMIRGEAGRDLLAHGRALDRRRHRPRAQDRAAGRAAGRPRGHHDDVPGRGEIGHRGAARDARAVHASPTATASTRSRTTAASAASTSAPNEDIQHADRDVDRAWTGMALVELPPGRFTMGSASTGSGPQRRRDAARRRDHAARSSWDSTR